MFKHRNARAHKEILPREIVLKPWEECIGIFRELRTRETKTAIFLSLVNGQTVEISFHRSSVEEKIVLKKLDDRMIGRKIGVLKVDDKARPILIRTFDERGHIPEETFVV